VVCVYTLTYINDLLTRYRASILCDFLVTQT